MSSTQTIEQSKTPFGSIAFLLGIFILIAWDFIDKRQIIDLHKNNHPRAFLGKELADISQLFENSSSIKKPNISHLNELSQHNNATSKLKENKYDLEFQIPIDKEFKSEIFLNKKMYFIDSEDSFQLSWLKRQIRGKEKRQVLVVDLYNTPSGRTIPTNINIYHDVNGELAKRFNILGLPAIVEQQDSHFIVKEEALKFSPDILMFDLTSNIFQKTFSEHLTSECSITNILPIKGLVCPKQQ